MTDRYPLAIAKAGPNGPFKASTTLDRLTATAPAAQREMAYIETDYTLAVEGASRALAASSRDADPRVYWLAGKALHDLLARISDLGFYLVHQNRTLARDLGISESSVGKLIAFCKRFPAVSLVDPSVPWSRYRANKVPRRGASC